MCNEQAVFLRTADGAEVTQTELNNVIIQLSAIALRNEIEHHFATRTISPKAARDVDLPVNALPRERQAAFRKMARETVAKPNAVFLMMRPKAR
jgi:hypothetical protein